MAQDRGQEAELYTTQIAQNSQAVSEELKPKKIVTTNIDGEDVHAFFTENHKVEIGYDHLTWDMDRVPSFVRITPQNLGVFNGAHLVRGIIRFEVNEGQGVVVEGNQVAYIPDREVGRTTGIARPAITTISKGATLVSWRRAGSTRRPS